MTTRKTILAALFALIGSHGEAQEKFVVIPRRDDAGAQEQINKLIKEGKRSGASRLACVLIDHAARSVGPNAWQYTGGPSVFKAPKDGSNYYYQIEPNEDAVAAFHAFLARACNGKAHVDLDVVALTPSDAARLRAMAKLHDLCPMDESFDPERDLVVAASRFSHKHLRHWLDNLERPCLATGAEDMPIRPASTVGFSLGHARVKEERLQPGPFRNASLSWLRPLFAWPEDRVESMEAIALVRVR